MDNKMMNDEFFKKLAEIIQMKDGTYVDTETGEVLENPPADMREDTKQDGKEKSWDQKMMNIMKEEKLPASRKYLNSDYYNGYGKVSPFNIIIKDHINEIMSMDPTSAKNRIIEIIEALNKEYAGDKSYDYVSADYIKKMKQSFLKMNTIDKITGYLYNIMFKGVGMGLASITDLRDKE